MNIQKSSHFEQLLRIPHIDSSLTFAVSPDEERLIFSWNKTGTWELWDMSLRAPERRSSLPFNEKIASGQSPLAMTSGAKFAPRFSPDGNQLAFAVDFDGSESYHIFLRNQQTGSARDLTPYYGYAQQPNFDFSPDGTRLAILSDELGQFALYILDFESGRKELLLNLHRPIWDVKWSPDGKTITVEVEWKASNRAVCLVDMESGTLRHGSASQGEAWKELALDGAALNAQHPAWSPDSKYLAFSAEVDEWHDIGLWDVETGEITWVDKSAGDKTQPTWSRDGETIGWVQAEGAKTSFRFKKIGEEVRQVEAGDGLHSFPHLLSDSVILIYEDVNHPPDLWKINLESGEAIQLTKSPGEEFDFRQPEEVWYEGMDGTLVPALLYRGEGKHAVVNIHGGPNWQFSFLWNPLMSYMAARGWTVLAPNYRGSTGYGKKWQNASRFDLGGVDTNDCAAGVKYLIENGLADADKIAVTGRSHGGYLTMCCLTMYPHLFAGGSAVVPFLNWIKSHFASREDLQHWNLENMGDPEENRELWVSHSPYFFLDRVNAPVQMICGENDPRCPASESLDARDKLLKLGKDVELHLYEAEGHVFLKIENVVDAEVKRMEFLEKILDDGQQTTDDG